MGFDASLVRKYVRTLPVSFPDTPAGNVLHVDYSAMEYSRIYRETYARLREALSKPDAKPVLEGAFMHDFYADVLSQVIVSWDYMDGAKPLPTTKAQLLKEPERFLYEIITAIGDDLNPKPLRDKTPASTPSSGSGLSLVG